MNRNDKSKVSVIVVNYNGAPYLSECLDSLLEQTYRGFELIVVDNNSSDGSAALVTTKYPDVRLLQLDTNRGYASAVNAGIRAASGEFIMILNNDIRADPDFVLELLSAMETDPSASMAAPKMLFARAPQTINSMGLGYSITGSNHDIGFGLRDGEEFESRKWVFGPCGGAGMYRRQVFEDTGPFDEEFFMYYEDVDFCFRAQLAGHKCVFIPGARIYHTEGASGKTLTESKNFYFARNALTVIIKNFPRRLIMRYFHVIAWEIVKRTVSPLLKRDTSAFRGYVEAIKHTRATLEKRREVQMRKRVADRYIENILLRNRSVLREINLRGRPIRELP